MDKCQFCGKPAIDWIGHGVAVCAAHGGTDAPPRQWLIRKSGLFYRPNRSGYTADVIAAGLYTQSEADAEARIEPNSISVHHASEYAAQIAEARENVARFSFT